ncbi:MULTISPECIES: PerC family transcriptional regulator [Rahnella]|uniref:PerC family transcriptional regulator n=1 Tax=Rahnella laticis TaxID=2787622 RepID=A0ABS0E2A1_9GAMM|nr:MULTISPECIES: PerC family transcriptional regulator [Rahnella]MBF7979186.1 PerC family transcriptional regulator [Rahnella laticis]MBF7999549.1 PerC family transcriptional regulator [Rahnella sp. LAC-M12]
MKVRDARAEVLEAAGLYRRAARRWLEVFDSRIDEGERDWLRQRRNACLRRVTRIKKGRDDLHFREVNQAANAALRRMGLLSGSDASPTRDTYKMQTDSKASLPDKTRKT